MVLHGNSKSVAYLRASHVVGLVILVVILCRISPMFPDFDRYVCQICLGSLVLAVDSQPVFKAHPGPNGRFGSPRAAAN